MGKVLAAYELGLFAVLVKYDQIYRERFVFDHDAPDALGRAGQRIHQAIRSLKREFGQGVPVPRMNRLVKSILDQERRRGPNSRRDPNALRDRWEELETLAADALRNHPRYHNWVELGLALGHCLLEMLEEQTLQELPSLKRAVRAVLLLPSSRVESVPVLKQMVVCARKTQPMTVLQFLGDLVGEETPDENHLANPGWEIVVKLDRLMQIMHKQVTQIPDGHELDVYLEAAHSQAVLDGKAYEISHTGAQILRVLLRRRGAIVKPHEWAEQEPLLKGVEIHKHIPKLPVAIKKLIKRKPGRGGGRWLDLD